MTKKAFTLVELMITLSIFFILIASSFVPYSYYSKKSSLNNAVKDISQSIYAARNLSINWLSSTSNLSVWAYFDSTEWENNSVKIFTYPYTFTWSSIIAEENDYIKIYKEIILPKWIQIDDVNWEKSWLFFFESISWIWSYFYFDDLGIKSSILEDEIEINVSYKWATSSNLQKQIR